MRDDVVGISKHVGEVCESKLSYVLDVPDVDLSGHVQLLFLLCFIAAWTCVVVCVMLVVCSLSVFLFMYLFALCV